MANLSSLNFRLSANIAPFRKGLNKAERSMDKLGRKMQQTGKNLSMKLTAPIAALGAMSFSVFKGFEQEMSKVQAVSGATAEEFKTLSDNAKELGASTMFSAREVAGLQGEFAKLGFTATEITKVTEATLSLAQASGSDLARAAMVAGSTLRAFGLDASQTGMVTDVMAKSFSTSAMDMETFAESMKFVAPVAKSAGMSIQETSAMLSVLANAGIKGSQAGTALRRIISEIGASGKPTAEALKDLAAQGLNLADAKDEVGRSAQSALLVLAGGVDQIAPLTEEFNNSSGAAKAMADIMGDTAFGASKRLESAMEGLGISIGEIVAVAVVPLIESLAKAASALNGMSKTAKKSVIVFAGLVAAAGPLLFLTGGLLRNFKLLKFAMVKSNTIVKIATALQKAYNFVLKANPIGIVIIALTALAAAFHLVNRRKKEAIGVEKKMSDSAKTEIANNQVRLNQANNLIDTIKSQNISNEQRSRLVRKLNTEYKDLLPNLISEQSSVQDIADAQKDMNKEMAKKIAMIAVQDEMTESVREAVEAQKLFNSSVKVSDELATKSQDLFGRVLNEKDVENYKQSLRSLTPEQASLVQQMDLNNTMLSVNKTKLDEASEAVVDIGKNVDKLAQSLAGVNGEGETFSDTLMDLPIKQFADDFKITLQPVFASMERGFVNTTALAIQAGNAFKNQFAAGIESAFDVLEEGETRFGNFLSTMLSGLKKLAIQFMAAAIAAAALAIAVRFAIGGAAGIGSVADIFGTMQSVAGFMPNIPMLESGGVVTGPTLAMIGEGNESEAVIPLSKLDTMIGSGGGGQNVVVTGRISGADILLSNERASRTRTRQRGF